MKNHKILLYISSLFFFLGLLPLGAAADTSAKKVFDIQVQGLKRVELEAIKNIITTRKNQALDPAKIKNDIKVIYSLGYFNDVAVDVKLTQYGFVVIYIIEEKPSIKQILLSGNSELDTDDIKEVIDIKTYSILSLSEVKRNVEKIRDLYFEKGYYLVEVTHKIDLLPGNLVKLTFVIRESTKVTVREIIFLGNRSFPDEELKGALYTREGGYFSLLTGSGSYKQELIQKDVDNLRQFYWDKGYLNVNISQPQVFLSGNKEAMYISFYISEGEQFTTGVVDISGDFLLPKGLVIGRVLAQTTQSQKEKEYDKAFLLFHTKVFEEALLAIDNAIVTDSNFVEALILKGDILMELRKREAATEAYSRVLEVEGIEPAKLHKYQAIANLRLGRLNEAVIAYKKAEVVNNRDPEIWFIKGDIQERLYNFMAAQLAYRKIEFLLPAKKDFRQLNTLGMSLMKQRKFAKAKKAFQKALKLQPKYFEAHENLYKCQLLEQTQLLPGKIFSSSKMRNDIFKVQYKYWDEGYANADVIPQYDIDEKRRFVTVNYTAVKGSKVYINRIMIRGNTRTRDKVIRREMVIAEGDLYSKTKLDASKARISRLGYFQQEGNRPKVDYITQKTGDPKYIDIIFTLEERPTGTFQIGVGISSIENFIGTAQIGENNLLGLGYSLNFQAQISSIRQFFNLRFYDPYFFDTELRFTVNVYNYQYVMMDFTKHSYGFRLSLGYQIFRNIYFNVGYKLEQVNVSMGGWNTRSDITVFNLIRDGMTSSINAFLTWDTRNNYITPTSGFLQTASIEIASPYLGSQNDFIKYTASSKWYIPLFWKVIGKINAEIGYISSTDPLGVPIFERFLLGGINSVRGFTPFSLGPKLRVCTARDPNCATNDDFNKGGNKELIFNFEVEFPIIEKAGISGVLFIDMGNAFDDTQNIDLAELRSAWGFGFRWYSPFGPLRFEWGLPFFPKSGERPIVFEFSIGNIF